MIIVAIKILQDLNQRQHNSNKKQFIEISFKSLVQIWVTFPLSTILIFNNNLIKAASRQTSVHLSEDLQLT